MSIEIITLPALADNYVFLIHNNDTDETALVDCPDDPIIELELENRGWTLSTILLTHHHWDHADGAAELANSTGAKILGAKADAHRLPKLDIVVEPGDSFSVAGATGHVINVPGHTVGHIAFHFPELRAAFTGDSLMAMGCGRLFEGTADQMWDSLQTLSALPSDTVLYSGHEYTQANARFAKTVDPDNPALEDRITEIENLRAANQPTVPSTLALELATNPFLRAIDPAVKAHIGMPNATDAQAFAEIRTRKDNF